MERTYPSNLLQGLWVRREGRGLTWRPKSGEQDGSCCWDNFLHDLSTSDQLFHNSPVLNSANSGVFQSILCSIHFHLEEQKRTLGQKVHILVKDTNLKILNQELLIFWSNYNMKCHPCFGQLTRIARINNKIKYFFMLSR